MKSIRETALTVFLAILFWVAFLLYQWVNHVETFP